MQRYSNSGSMLTGILPSVMSVNLSAHAERWRYRWQAQGAASQRPAEEGPEAGRASLGQGAAALLLVTCSTQPVLPLLTQEGFSKIATSTPRCSPS